MEKKYDPIFIQAATANRVFLKFSNDEIRKLTIIIEIDDSNNECYTIKAKGSKLTCLFIGERNQEPRRKVKLKTLYEKRNLLGNVIVKVDDNKYINLSNIKFNEFWEKIKRG